MLWLGMLSHADHQHGIKFDQFEATRRTYDHSGHSSQQKIAFLSSEKCLKLSISTCLYTVYTYIWHIIWHATFFNFIQLIATPSSSPFSPEIPGPASDEDGSWSLRLLKSWMAGWLDGFYFKRSQLSNKSWFILWWIHDELIVEDNLGDLRRTIVLGDFSMRSTDFTIFDSYRCTGWNHVQSMHGFCKPFPAKSRDILPKSGKWLASNCLILSYRTFPYSSNPSNLESIENDLWPTSVYAGLGLAIHVPTFTGHPGCLGKITSQDISQ